MSYQQSHMVNTLARRVERERSRRDWSAGELQRRLADVGCRVPKNRLTRLESGVGGGVDLDLLIGLTKVFDLEKVDDLLVPLAFLDDRAAAELVHTIEASVDQVVEAAEVLWDAVRQLIGPDRRELSEDARALAMERFGEYAAGLRIEGAPFLVEHIQGFLLAMMSGGIREAIERAGGPRADEPFPDDLVGLLLDRMERRNGQR